VESRAGFKEIKESELSAGRQKLFRYLLLSEFREISGANRPPPPR